MTQNLALLEINDPKNLPLLFLAKNNSGRLLNLTKQANKEITLLSGKIIGIPSVGKTELSD